MRTEVNFETGEVTKHQDYEVNPEAIRAPKPIDQIRAKEQAQNVRDAMERANRLAALITTRTELVRQQASKGVTVTHDQAHAWLVVNDKYYKLLWELEQEIEPLRKQIV